MLLSPGVIHNAGLCTGVPQCYNWVAVKVTTDKTALAYQINELGSFVHFFNKDFVCVSDISKIRCVPHYLGTLTSNALL
ncbi:hypothetical protein SRHO_G00081170 [Serrasalmus rhombeus]